MIEDGGGGEVVIDFDSLYYKWDWGDGNVSNWIGPLDHGEVCVQSHQWSKEGDYEIRVKIRDHNGGQSEWSNPSIVRMPKYKNVHFPRLNWIFSKLPWNFPFLNLLLNGDYFE